MQTVTHEDKNDKSQTVVVERKPQDPGNPDNPGDNPGGNPDPKDPNKDPNRDPNKEPNKDPKRDPNKGGDKEPDPNSPHSDPKNDSDKNPQKESDKGTKTVILGKQSYLAKTGATAGIIAGSALAVAVAGAFGIFIARRKW